MNSCGSCGETTDNDFVLCDDCEQQANDSDAAVTAEVERLRAENAELREANKTLLNQLGWFVNREGYVIDVLGADATSLPIRVSVLRMRMREKPMPGAGE